MYASVGIFRSFGIGGNVSSHCIDAYCDLRRQDGRLNSISSGIGLGVIGVASIGDPNVEYDTSSIIGHCVGMSVAFLTSSYSSSFIEDSSSRDDIIGSGADAIDIPVLYLISALGQQVSVFITSPCENPF
jgi:hypothetical protein